MKSDDPAFPGNGYVGMTIADWTFIQSAIHLRANKSLMPHTVIVEAKELTQKICKELDREGPSGRALSNLTAAAMKKISKEMRGKKS